jgi:hypothetical protein
MVPIPNRLLELLAGSEYLAPVQAFNSAVAAILADNKMPFFPGYTDHGLEHVGRVIATVVRLVPTEIWEAEPRLIGPADSALIICSTLLHDLAMHLREDGFLKLIGIGSANNPLPWFSQGQPGRSPDLPWPKLWDDFLREARRFADRDLINIFGPPPDDSSQTRSWGVRELSQDPREWDYFDRLLVGEFLRRHHHRLAHEIAVYGFPGLTSGTSHRQFRSCPTEFAEPFSLP